MRTPFTGCGTALVVHRQRQPDEAAVRRLAGGKLRWRALSRPGRHLRREPEPPRCPSVCGLSRSVDEERPRADPGYAGGYDTREVIDVAAEMKRPAPTACCP